MQIPYVKYLKTKNQDTLLVYFERNALFFKIGTNSGWSHAQMIADEVNPSFALSYYNGEAFLLYSTRLGELYIVRTSDFVKWDRKQISIEKKDLSQTKFFMTTDQSALHLFYHLPTETAGVHALIYTVFRNGKWEKPCQIDRFLPFGQTPFLTGKRNPRHIMLYYRSVYISSVHPHHRIPSVHIALQHLDFTEVRTVRIHGIQNRLQSLIFQEINLILVITYSTSIPDIGVTVLGIVGTLGPSAQHIRFSTFFVIEINKCTSFRPKIIRLFRLTGSPKTHVLILHVIRRKFLLRIKFLIQEQIHFGSRLRIRSRRTPAKYA